MSEALFLRLLSVEDKGEVMASAIAAMREGQTLDSIIHTVDPLSFEQVPGSPFAYWVSEGVRRLFTKFAPFESERRTTKQGLATADDFRFVRAWWEVPPSKILTGEEKTKPDEFRRRVCNGKRWVPFAKGGAYSPYYADLYLVVNWENEGEEIKSNVNDEGRIRSNIWMLRDTAIRYFFRAGLTWPLRTNGLSFRVLPKGCVFAHKGPAAFVLDDIRMVLLALSAVMNSLSFYLFVKMLVARVSLAQSFEVGLVQSIPIPSMSRTDIKQLENLVTHIIDFKRNLDRANEFSHIFYLPSILQTSGDTLTERSSSWQQHIDETERQLANHQREIDEAAFQLYGIDDTDREAIGATSVSGQASADDGEVEAEAPDDTEQPTVGDRQLTVNLLSYFVGCAFGRWDVRYAIGEQSAPELQDSFAPLPVCAPGALTGSDGLPVREVPPSYPLRIDWDGILVDDPQHSDDIIRGTHDVFELIWQERAEEIEREACELLGVKTLRDYFRKPAAGGFWTHHVKRYSKSRRRAPIYWYLRSSKGTFAIWLYYHRLDKDILFKVLLNYVEPKLHLEENNLAQVKQRREVVGTTGREGKQLERDLDKQESFLSELYDFRDKLKRAADLNLEPDLNDGVVLNIAPLWELVPWKEAEKYWKELIAGKYEWSSIAKQLRERGLIKQ
jgi:hypothetical protein